MVEKGENPKKKQNSEIEVIESSVENESEINDFEKICNYKKYFPHNNFFQIRESYNKGGGCSKMNRRKINEVKKLSRYTFYAVPLLEKVKTRSDKIKRSRLESNEHSAIRSGKESSTIIRKKDPESAQFIDLISNLVKSNRLRKKNKKWYTPIENFFKKTKV